MKISFNKILRGIILLIFYLVSTYAQVATLKPERPKWGDKLTVIYNPQIKGAKFSLTDDVYIVGILYYNHESNTFWAKMEKQKNVFINETIVKKGLSFVKFYFITLTDWDRAASVSSMIYSDDGVPARGAYLRKMYHSEIQISDSLFYKELSLYPDNYCAYRDKWFMANVTQKSKIDSIVRTDMEMLAKKVKKETAEYLYALSYGYLLLKQEEKSRSVIKRLIELYPDSPLTGQALDSYEYQVFAQQLKGDGPKEINELKLNYIMTFPNIRYAREQVEILASREDFPLEAVEAICIPWKKEVPDHPWPYYSLAIAYLKHNKKLEKAGQLMDRAITLMLQGKLRLYEDISGSITKMTLPEAYVRRAEIAMKRKNYAIAIASLKAAQFLKDETNPKALIMEANIWQELSNLLNAEFAYSRAWQEGSIEAEDSLKKIYKRRHGNLSDFEKYLQKIKEKADKDSDKKIRAPAFKVTSLKGENFNLDALRGKVVVLNFWFIGCAPCRVEIPGLNKLVDEFKDQEVIFIGFALNDEKELNEFLKTTKFRYHIIAKSGKIAKQYQISGYPTHIIVNKNGYIEARLVGGNKNRYKELKTIITRLLKS